jgi:DNA polymerase II small subunit
MAGGVLLSKGERISEFAKEKQLILSKAAFELLKESMRWKDILEEALKRNLGVVDEKFVHSYVFSEEKATPEEEKFEAKRIEFFRESEVEKLRQKAREIEPDFRIRHEYDVTGKLKNTGKIEDFHNFFGEKFDFVSELFKKRGLEGTIDKIKRMDRNREGSFIAMVAEKWITKKGHLALRLEDYEDEIIAIISKDDEKLFKEGETILEDEVLAIKGVNLGKDLFAVKEFFRPDVPIESVKKAERDVSVLFIGDTQIGSKLFLEESFIRMMEWLNLKIGSEKDLEDAAKIKYVVFVGDLVDGLGVYPGQFEELHIKDIYEQYSAFTRFVEMIPEYVEVFIIPGNHDACRIADPRPAIDPKFCPDLYKMKNVHMLGSPSMIELEGVKVLVYHGDSIYSLTSKLGYLNPQKPVQCMEEFMKRRDLFPVYGERQIVVPEQKNYMLMREVPDIFATGHVHKNDYGKYRDRLLLNCGTWQKITQHMIDQGAAPTPGRATIVNLKTLGVSEKIFWNE